LAIAKMIGCGAIFLTISGVTAPCTDRPRKTSAPSIASSSVRVGRIDGVGGLELVRRPRGRL
jgi:hypothetical protein